ncbi:hypothetical protein [Nitrosococcus watsonii]|uniref:Uncharacterized protein n=1 Tax=Nitrosococcus watsoni (strain C-113) TaxID=105559 RepID=D8KAQ3_NITWC|nr:hypothetical protein [Nitrosococcus watsonii]ADJ29480.1 hypothetical protein Nwat_2714 [Nitrosococcus watsonii C-113]
MNVWLILIGGSTLTGFLTATLLKKNWAIYVAGAVPWFALLAALLYTEYFTAYEGGGASMWLIAQLFGGTVGAVVGVVSYKLTTFLFKGNTNAL